MSLSARQADGRQRLLRLYLPSLLLHQWGQKQAARALLTRRQALFQVLGQPLPLLLSDKDPSLTLVMAA